MKSDLPSNLSVKLQALPKQPGVYLFKDRRGRVLYVGKALVLRNRVRSYFNVSSPERNPWLEGIVSRITDFEVLTTRSEKEALILECNLIKLHRPPFNIRFKDDKGYPFLKVTLNEPYPTVTITRQPKDDIARYFGPYPDGRALRETIELLKRLFGVRTMTVVNERRKSGCPWRDTNKLLPRACLEFHILRCLGPCISAVTPEEYRSSAERLCEFLEGRTGDVLKRLEQEMWEAAEREEFEKATKRREQIRAIQKLTERQAVMLSVRDDIDAYAFVSEMGLGCVQMVLVRGGMVIGDQHFIVRVEEGQSPAEVLSAFVKHRYASGVPVPKIVLLPVELDDAKVIAEWLSDKRGKAVSVRTAVSGILRDLLNIAESNAHQKLREELQREEQERLSYQNALLSLQTHLNLPTPLYRIECYDISTTMGIEPVGAMVVFMDGKPARSEYRKFRIKHTAIDERPSDDASLSTTANRTIVGLNDDYAAMREVLTRRFRHFVDGDPKFAKLPDLLLLDGGKGQLSVAMQVLGEFNLKVPAAALAKEHELLYVPYSEAPIALPFNSPALHLLQRIRDETHRYVIGFHRKRRARKMLRTLLDEVIGIGEVRKKALLQHFGSLDALMQASVDELAKVPHMTIKVAKALWQFLHEQEKVLTPSDPS